MTTIDERSWRPRLQRLTASLVADGYIRSQAWRQAVERTPRHVFVPRFYADSDASDGRVLVDGSNAAFRETWLDAVYSDDTLVTQLRAASVPDEYGGGTQTRSTSSSTKPSVMLAMLEDLDVHEGQRVLEIGTGTGYTAALLCARLGDANIASIDIHPDVVADACQRLADLGQAPKLEAGDGTNGLPAAAPYDRIIATCAVSQIPAAWIEQTRPGGIILADLRGDVSGGLVKLHKKGDGTTTGRFLSYPAPFMWLREHPEHPLRERERPYLLRDTSESRRTTTVVDPKLLQDPHFAFLAQLHLPRVSRFPPTAGTILLYRDESTWAEASTALDGPGVYRVTYSGTRNLWDQVEAAHQVWEHAGHPMWERFGLTATPQRQWIWLDTPDSSSMWRLPL